MKRIASRFGALVVLSFCSLSYSNAQEQTTPNLITSGTNHTWTGVTTGSVPAGCATAGPCPGGPGALYDPATNTINFSYGQATAAQTFAINQALSNAGAGIQVQGYNYSWDIRNLNGDNRQSGVDTLTARVLTYQPNNVDIRRTDSWTYNTKFDWTTFSGAMNYITPGPTSDFGNLRVEFTGMDGGFWGGYFGPQVRNVNVSMRYTVDQCTVNPQSSPSCPGFKTFYNMGDDGYSIVPIPFGFPLYGRTFTHSIFFDNGLVSFYDPVTEAARLGGQQYWAEPLSNNLGSQFHYSIMPLWTDLAPNSNSKYYTQTDSNNFFRYTWENLQQYGYSNRPNTFSLEIKPSGSLGIQYTNVNIGGYPITSGVVGNAALGEWTQTFRSNGEQVGTGGISDWSLNSTQATNCSNPLSNPACPGYAAAFLTQQCTINPLYNTQCPGYQTAYFTQQCSLNTLYNVDCPGYATAYYNYQCSANPLYHTGCPGYEQAYFTQQCTANPLYNSGCQGYETAYYNQQCGLNPLYNTTCPGYADAYYVQQCTISPLYDTGCTGYAAAYFSQQCTLDGLYDRTCPNYAEAFAKKNILNISTPTSPAVVQESVPVVVVASSTSSNSPQVVADPIVNQAITTTATSASPAAAATTTVPLAPAPQPAAATTPAAVAAAETKKEEKKEEAKKEETKTESTSTATASTSSSSDNKNEPKTTRQALAERRLEAARAKAVDEGKNMANKMGEAATMEAQVAIQNVVVQAMGFTPGFDAYGRVRLQDAAGYRPFEVYKGQRNIDTPSGRRFMTGSDKLHTEMIDSQYNFGRNQ